MATIDHVIIETPIPDEAERFYAALALLDKVRARHTEEPSEGFRGFTLSLITAQPANVDNLMEMALTAGATPLQLASKSMWGYGGSVHAPDGTVVTIASSSKKNSGPASPQIDNVIVQLGVADVPASKQFYTEHGFEVGKSFGRKYVELNSGPAVTLTLNSRDVVAKNAGIDPAGDGSHRLVIVGDAGAFTDPDGYVSETL